MASDFFRENPQVSYQGARWYKLPDSTESVHLRFLPPGFGEPKPGKLVWYHYGIMGIRKLFCFSTYGLECPLCSQLDEIEMTWPRDDVSKKKRTARSFFNVLLIGDPTRRYNYNSITPCLIGIPGSEIYEWVIRSLTDPTVGNITDPHLGRSVYFQREYRKGPFRKSVSHEIRPLADTEERIQSILNCSHDLEKVWPAPDHQATLRMQGICEAFRNKNTSRFSW